MKTRKQAQKDEENRREKKEEKTVTETVTILGRAICCKVHMYVSGYKPLATHHSGGTGGLLPLLGFPENH